MTRTHRQQSAGLCLLLAALCSAPASAQEGESETTSEPETSTGSVRSAGFEDVPQFGGPSGVGSQLMQDDRPREPILRFESLDRWLEPWFDFKGGLAERRGLAFGLDYTALYTGASSSPGERDAASGIFRLFGSWTLLGRGTNNTGALVFKGENRHTLGTAIPPSGLGFETGYVGLPAAPYNDRGWWLTNFFWQQKTNDGRLNFQFGQLDATDYLDIYGMINPWKSFTNLTFLTGSGTIPVPDQGFGAAFGAMLGDQAYLVAGLADLAADPSDPFASAKSFFEDNDYFSHVELGWTSEQGRAYLDNAHVTLWHADASAPSGAPEGWGATASYARFVDDAWMPFLRGGYSEDGGALLTRSISAGLGHYWNEDRDLLGFGVNWGRPSSDFGADLPDQWTSELFYRFQLSEHLAITPDIQYVVDPALNPGRSGLIYFGLRARLAL